VPVFKILNHVVDYMEETGSTYMLVSFSIEQAEVDKINSKNGTNFSLEDIENATDKCLAHEWLAYSSMGSKYRNLRITPKGIGVARSRSKSEELKLTRTRLKKMSDYIDEHKGLFILLALVLGLATFGLKIFKG